MSAWGSAGAEAKLRSFVTFAIDKLEEAAPEFEDADGAEENYEEICTWARGMSRNLKNTGAKAAGELKGEMSAALAEVWDLKTDTAGPALKEGMVPALVGALSAMIAEGGCLYAEPEPEPEPAAEEEEPSEEAEAAKAARLQRMAMNPQGISDMSLEVAINHAWDNLDKGNRLEWGEDGFAFDTQRKGRFGKDTCPDPLFNHMNMEHPFWSSQTTTAFIALLDNYEREVGVAEKVTREEKVEMEEFLDAICSTPVMVFAFNWLRRNGVDKRCKKNFRNMADFQTVLYDIWLAPYRRGKGNDSSGFEHVFVGEEKNGKIMGLHNWIQYYLEEKKGLIDYLGFKGKQDADNSDDVNIVSVAFTWADDDPESETKPMSTILCGCTIEWEMAALTMAFLGADPEGENVMHLGSEQVKITCHHQRQRVGGTKVGSAYFEMA